jgi:hypothetical protein
MAEHIGYILKDPDDIKACPVDWAPKLASGVTISTATGVAPSGITLVSTTTDGETVNHFVSGGTSGQTYRLTSRVTLSDTQQLDAEFDVVVQ